MRSAHVQPSEWRETRLLTARKQVGIAFPMELVLRMFGIEESKTWRTSMNRKLILLVFLAISLSAAGAMAQETAIVPSHEISVQGTGFFTKGSSGNGINQRG